MLAIRFRSGFATAFSGAFAVTLALGSMLTMPSARADDIDLFTGADGEQYAPNILVLIANQANWTSNLGSFTQKEMEHLALQEVFTDPALAGTIDSTDDPIQLRLGFGIFSQSNSPRGAKIIQAVDPLTSSYQDEISSMLYEEGHEGETGHEKLETSNNAPYALSLNEAFAYYAGEQPISGKADDDDDKAMHSDPEAYTTQGDPSAHYVSPAQNSCGKNYVILIGNGEPDSGEDNPAEDWLAERGGLLSGDPIDLDPSNFESNWSDEFARHMSRTEVVPDDIREDHQQNVRTYVIDVFDSDSNQSDTNKFKGARSWLTSIAQRGGGTYYEAHNTADIKSALKDILNELFAENDVFAASTLPVSVNVRGTNLNQVYMGVFRPDEKNRTRWQGNLKLYQLAVDPNGVLQLADSDGKKAQGDSGFIRNDAVSFWTYHWNFWDFDPRGAAPDRPASDHPDGEVVEKGGVHQQVRQPVVDQLRGGGMVEGARRLLSTSQDDCGTAGCALAAFEDVADAGSLGVTADDPYTADDLIAWVYGENNVPADVAGDPDTLPKSDADDNDADYARPTIHGDVLHSQPAVVNYGDRDGDGEGDVYAFYGANDGVFHAIKGSKEVDGAGQEIWGFVPSEFFGQLKELRDLSQTDHKEYFADGSVGVYKHDGNDDGLITAGDDSGDRVILYIAMRRGGRMLYALDVTAPEEVGYPKFLWKVDTSDSAELGQTWSRPELHTIEYTDPADDSTVKKEVLIFGGGYDPGAEDPDTDDDFTGTASMGRAFYVVDAMSGELIWQAGASTSNLADADATATEWVSEMTYAIPSDVTVLDRDGDSFADRLYVGDTGGQLWRADIDGAPSDWQVYRLASDGEAASDPERKFLYPPDVVYHEDSNGRFDAVLIGSGDRADPFERDVLNRFYMFKDRQTPGEVDTDAVDSKWPLDPDADLLDVTASPTNVNEADLDAEEGWYIDLLDDAGGTSGEKVVSSAVTLGGTTFFNTNEPPPEAAADDECTQALGIARNYEVSFEDGTGMVGEEGSGDRSNKAEGGGFPPSPVPVIVEIDGEIYEVVLSGTSASEPPGTSMGRRNPVYWNKKIDD